MEVIYNGYIGLYFNVFFYYFFKKQVEELENKLIKEKETMFALKGKAKEDLQWILGE